MLKMLADNRNRNSLATRFRQQRFKLLSSLLACLDGPIQILDIGGTEAYWNMMPAEFGKDISIILLNLAQEKVSSPNLTSVVGDARQIEAKDSSFDVVFSNSVIEHVGSFHDQRLMATEVQRVGKRYFIQTPNRNFPLEPHFLFPFFQFLPLNVRVWLLRNFRLGWFPKTPDPEQARRVVSQIRLLNERDFISLFPAAEIHREKALGLTKSFVAYGGWGDE